MTAQLARGRIGAVMWMSCLAALALPATAAGAVTAEVVDGTLVIRGEGTETNVVEVRLDGPSYKLVSPVGAIGTGPGCLQAAMNHAYCSADVGAAVVRGGDGPDVIDLFRVPIPVNADGGPGDDALRAGAKGGVLRGGPGIDQLIGGNGKDRLEGEADDDLLEGRAGADDAFGGDGADVVAGGSGGRDVLVGGDGPDLLKGGEGRDLLDGGAGGDALVGGPGGDALSPGSGDDRVFGVRGGDVLQCPTPAGAAAAPAPCADVVSAAAPASWPPAATTATASVDGFGDAWPKVPGDADAIQVHIPAATQHPIHVCIATKNWQLRPFPRYKAWTTTRFYPVIRTPSPRKLTFFADVYRLQAC